MPDAPIDPVLADIVANYAPYYISAMEEKTGLTRDPDGSIRITRVPTACDTVKWMPHDATIEEFQAYLAETTRHHILADQRHSARCRLVGVIDQAAPAVFHIVDWRALTAAEGVAWEEARAAHQPTWEIGHRTSRWYWREDAQLADALCATHI
jgi:hypothetical protein